MQTEGTVQLSSPSLLFASLSLSYHWLRSSTHPFSFEALTARFTKPQYKDSFVATAKVIRALAVIRPTLERKFAEQFVSSLNLQALTEQRLAKVTDEDLKTLDKEQLAALSIHVQGLTSVLFEFDVECASRCVSHSFFCLFLLVDEFCHRPFVFGVAG